MGEKDERIEIETHGRVNPPQSVPDSDKLDVKPPGQPKIAGRDDEEDEG